MFLPIFEGGSIMEVFDGGRGTPKQSKSIWIGLVVALLALTAWSCVYTVQEQEHAAIVTFGKYTSTQTSSGLHFKLPFPIQQVVLVQANVQQKLQIGYREVNGETVSVDEEALMITGDENIVSADAVVEWKIFSVREFLFNIEDPETFLRNAASAAIRSVIGSSKLDFAITEGKTVIQTEVKEKLESLMNTYNTGIQVVDVKFQDIEPPQGAVQQAFKDVTNAREEKNTKINQAQKYVNERLPKARGEARALIEQANAQKNARILNAQGDVAKFNAIQAEFANNGPVTKQRLVLETLEKVLPNAKVILTDNKGTTISTLPINELMRKTTPEGGPK
jgi:membrane protease subunit HflK